MTRAASRSRRRRRPAPESARHSRARTGQRHRGSLQGHPRRTGRQRRCSAEHPEHAPQRSGSGRPRRARGELRQPLEPRREPVRDDLKPDEPMQTETTPPETTPTETTPPETETDSTRDRDRRPATRPPRPTATATAAARFRRGTATAGGGGGPAPPSRGGEPSEPAHRGRGPLRDRAPPRGRGHVDRLHGEGHRARAAGGREAARRAPRRRRGLRVPLPARGALGRAAPAPEHRAGVRLRPGPASERHYIVMEYVDGPSAADMLRERKQLEHRARPCGSCATPATGSTTPTARASCTAT